MASLATDPSTVHTRTTQRREGRYASVEWLRSRTKRRGGRTCMLARLPEVVVGATASGAAGIQGVKRCASPWACECCAPTIGERRAGEADAMMAAWLAAGGSVLFVTATLSHLPTDRLGTLLDQVQEAWSRTWRWEAPRFGTGEDTYGLLLNGEYGPGRYDAVTWKGKPSMVRPEWYAGQMRAIEITYGTGWHPHVHAAVFVEPGCDVARATAAVKAHAKRWAESVAKMGGRTIVTPVLDTRTKRLVVPGWDVRPVTDAGAAAKYLTKVEGGWGAGLELARLDLKTPRNGGMKPFDLLHRAMAGDVACEELWFEYERETKARQRIVVSPGLAARCGVEMAEDDDAAIAELDGAPVAGAVVPAKHWRALWRRGEAAALVSAVAGIAQGLPVSWDWPPGWLATWNYRHRSAAAA